MVLALAGIRAMSAAADVPASNEWETVLDAAIYDHKEYAAVREARIEALRRQRAAADTATAEYFRLNAEMYQEYKAYICDSALHYLSLNLRWARRHGRHDAADEKIGRAHV